MSGIVWWEIETANPERFQPAFTRPFRRSGGLADDGGILIPADFANE